MFAENGVVFAESEFVRVIHGIFFGVIEAKTGFFRD